MTSNLKKSAYAAIGEAVMSTYLARESSRSVSIFLCGGKMSGESARLKFYNATRYEKNFQIRFPEGLFDELLEKKAYNLLELEEMLANSVDAIVIFPESPGSWAELGAFSGNEHLRNKIVCIIEHKYRTNFSFINLGPVRVLKKSASSKVISFKYSEIGINIETKNLASSIKSGVRQIKKAHPTKSLGLFDLEDLLTIILYCLDSATWSDLRDICRTFNSKFTTLDPTEILDICIETLLTQRKIEKSTNGGFILSKRQAKQLEHDLTREQLRLVQQIRVEAMNAIYRRHAEVKRSRMPAFSP